MKGVVATDIPRFFVAMDGKPSDRYVRGGKYCLAMLTASSSDVFFDLGDRVNNELNKKGLRLIKLSKIRSKKRRIKYTHSVLDILLNLSRKEQGLRINYRIVLSNSEVMNPEKMFAFYKENDAIRDFFNITVNDDYIEFNYEGKKIKIHRNDYGGFLWWNYNLLKIAEENEIIERNITFWVHMDRLPGDRHLERTKLLGSILDFSLQGKLWISLSGNDLLAIDIWPDFFANIFYDSAFNKQNIDHEILRKINELNILNTKEYWGIQ